MQAQALRQLDPQHRQRDLDAAPRAQHHVEVAVVRVAVVVDVAAEAQVAKEELVERAQPLQRRGIGGQAALQARQQLVDVAQHLLHVEIGVFVLRQAGRRFQQREMVVALHQRAEVFQRRRDFEIQRHDAIFVMDGPASVKRDGRRARASARDKLPQLHARRPRARRSRSRPRPRSMRGHQRRRAATACARMRDPREAVRAPTSGTRASSARGRDHLQQRTRPQPGAGL